MNSYQKLCQLIPDLNEETLNVNDIVRHLENLGREIKELKQTIEIDCCFTHIILALREAYDKAEKNSECAEILRLFTHDWEGFRDRFIKGRPPKTTNEDMENQKERTTSSQEIDPQKSDYKGETSVEGN